MNLETDFGGDINPESWDAFEEFTGEATCHYRDKTAEVGNYRGGCSTRAAPDAELESTQA
jgi:hypothetical protein